MIELEVPGYSDKELTLEVSDQLLTIKGTREEVKGETEKTFRLHERLESEFERTFAFPPDVDTEHVAARFVNGVLEVRAPKLSIRESRTIPIST